MMMILMMNSQLNSERSCQSQSKGMNATVCRRENRGEGVAWAWGYFVSDACRKITGRLDCYHCAITQW